MNWFDQPTEPGWWWYRVGNEVCPRLVLDIEDVKSFPGRWARVIFPDITAPEIIDRPTVRVKHRDSDAWVTVYMFHSGNILFVWDDGELDGYTERYFCKHFHVPIDFKWPENMLGGYDGL